MKEENTRGNSEVLVLEAVAEDFRDLSSLFRELGFRVVVSSGPDPLRFLAGRSVDLLVMNLHYPDVDPFPFLAMARKKGIRTIVVSRSFHQEEARAACRMGAEVVWDLPIDREQFLKSFVFPRKKILVIDDVEDTRSVFVRTLKSGSYDVLEACTGEEGFSLAKKYPLDLILLDVGLPDISGIELRNRLRLHSLTASIPVLICTVRGRDEGLESMEAYIQKPISPKRLLERISNYFPIGSGKS